MSNGVLTIGVLAERTGTKVETIRFYERCGLLQAPARTQGNYRAYEPAHFKRLSFVRRARDLGFSLDQVKELVALSDDQTQPCAAVDDIARAHRGEVERKIRDLQALRDELDRLLGRCACSTIAECRIIETLSP